MPRKPHKFEADGDFIEHLEGEERRKRIPLDEVLPRMDLWKTDVVVDLGSGTGYFAFPIAQFVKQVICIDIEDKMLHVVAERVSERSVDNMQVLKGDMNCIPIADSIADHLFAAFVYHEVGDQAKLLAECARVLRPGGRLTVIDFPKRFGGDGPPFWVRKSPGSVRKTASPWFEPVASSGSKGYYQLTFSKK